MGRWDNPNRKVPSIFLTHNEDISKNKKEENHLILDSNDREKSYYAQIDIFPYYIHNNKDNFNLTAKDIDEKDVSTNNFRESEFIKKFLEAQILREDKLLISLFGSKDVDITSKFEEYGFILPKDQINAIIKELDNLKNDTDFSNDLKKIAEGKTNLKYEPILSGNKLDINKFKTELEKEWKIYTKKVNDITKNLDQILKEIGESTESLPTLLEQIKKLQKLTTNGQTPQKTIITELHKINGRVSNYYRNITEGYNIITKEMILNDISGKFSNGTVTIMGEADAYRAQTNINNTEKAKTYAKSDMIIVLKQNNVIIPLGGISVKKTDSSTKFHNTTSLSALLDSLKETEIMYDDLNHDKNLFRYTGINKLMHPDSNNVSNIFDYIARKYGVIFVMGGIANTVLNNSGSEKNDTALTLPGSSIFKSEHADFLYRVSITKGISEVVRMSDEIKNLYSELKMRINYIKPSIGEQKRKNDLKKLQIEKGKVEHYTYENINQNNEVKRIMLDMYKEHSTKLDARIIVG